MAAAVIEFLVFPEELVRGEEERREEGQSAIDFVSPGCFVLIK